MTDLIRREAAIAAVRSVCIRIGKKCIDCTFFYDGCLAEKQLKALPSEELGLQTPQTYGKSIDPSNAEVVADYISRADAIDAFTEDGTWLERQCVTSLTMVEAKQRAVDILSSLPSAEYSKPLQTTLNDSAEAVQGEWIEVEVFPEVYDIEGVKTWGSEMQCDQCGFRLTAIEGHMAQYNFCPNCGADMRKEKP